MPQAPRAVRAGVREVPRGVREYSTLGGISLYWRRVMILWVSRDLESIRLEMPGRRRWSSLKRMVSCWLSSQRIRSFHFPLSRSKAYFTGQSFIVSFPLLSFFLVDYYFLRT